MRAGSWLFCLFFCVLVGLLGVALSGCKRPAEGDMGFENLSDLANAEATAAVFVASLQAAPFVSSDGAAWVYVERGEHGFVAVLAEADGGAAGRKSTLGMRDIEYDSRVQTVAKEGLEVTFLYEELSFYLEAVKAGTDFSGDGATRSRFYRTVDTLGALGVAGTLRLTRGGAAAVLHLTRR